MQAVGAGMPGRQLRCWHAQGDGGPCPLPAAPTPACRPGLSVPSTGPALPCGGFLAGGVSGRTCTAYPACGYEVKANGGIMKVRPRCAAACSTAPVNCCGCPAELATQLGHAAGPGPGRAPLLATLCGPPCKPSSADGVGWPACCGPCMSKRSQRVFHTTLHRDSLVVQDVEASEVVVDGNLVTAPAWPAHPKWLAAFVDLLGYKVGLTTRKWKSKPRKQTELGNWGHAAPPPAAPRWWRGGAPPHGRPACGLCWAVSDSWP